jgi:arylsulfatase
MPKQTIDVLMGGYLSKDAAHEDFEAVQACSAPLLGLVVVSKALDGSMEIEQHDHIVKEGAVAFGGAGFVVGLFAPPLLVATAVGAVVGAGVGRIAQRKVESGTEKQAQETIPIGGAGLIVVYEHKHADVIEAAVKRAIKKVVGEATDSHIKAVKAALADASEKMAADGA